MPRSGNPAQQGRNSSGDQPARTLAVQFSEIARKLQAEDSLDATLQAIVESAVVNIDGADYASITLVTGGGRLSTPAATDDLVVQIDRVQYETGEGPCLSAISEEATVLANDLRNEARWPRFASRAADLGVLSMLSFQLYVRERDLGALNLHSRSAGVFTEADEDIGLLFATHAAIALVGAQHEHHLHRQQLTADLIGQAKGILMERHKLTAATAFQLLARASQTSNRRLVDIADDVTTSGREPAGDPRR